MIAALQIIGGLAGLFLAGLLLWSILRPERRLWPVGTPTLSNQIMVWGPTVAVFVSAALIGVLDWNGLGIPAWLRWGVGLPLVVAGNLVVWPAVLNIGWAATSGAEGQLKTDGGYRWSRNPQYVADIAILAGWSILSGNAATLPVTAAGILALALAPLAEEPWLEETYGAEYRAYRKRVGRYLSWPA
ncbi:methyltransferase family protein [Alterinioella nitratireducens]|uniref:methyltransferase family protein n=1 Tax=Alterinioella nitratireducens TaxID=2735915 RepID=UPI0040599164